MLVHRHEQSPERAEVHQQVVHHHPDIAEITRHLVGQHQSVHSSERMVRSEHVTSFGVQPLHTDRMIADIHVPEGGPYERYPLQVSESRQNLVHLPLVYGTAKIIDDETRDATGKLRILAFEHLVYVYLLHRVFPLVRPASVSTFP